MSGHLTMTRFTGVPSVAQGHTMPILALFGLSAS